MSEHPQPARPGLITRLYRGETRIGFIQSRRRWYLASAILILVCVVSFVVRGFNYSVEFSGGSQFQVQDNGRGLTATQVSDAFSRAGLAPDGAAQIVGSGSTRQVVVKTKNVDTPTQVSVQNAVQQSLGLPKNAISATSVSSDWGHDITVKAVEGLIIFLILVSIYISAFFAWRMAVGAVVALLHDLIIAAGVYSLVGFEVSPSTIVGLLTILGFSLYDTVVVFDKVRENSKDLTAGSRMTFTEAANLAVNQTLMRSINTSLIGLLPVAGLLFVGSLILGVGTIKDLALILFVGLIAGAYSSLFLATPVVVDLTERDPRYKALTRRVQAKRSSDRAAAVDSVGSVGTVDVAPRRLVAPAPAPKPGARPARGPKPRRR